MPDTAPAAPAAPDPVRIIRRADRMAADRSVHETGWDEIRDLLDAQAASFKEIETPGTKSHRKVFDNTGEMASELLAAGMMGLAYSQSSKFFGLRAADDAVNRRRDVAAWLQEATRRMHTQFGRPEAGFETHQQVKLRELGDYGTGGMFIADRPGFGPVYQSRPLRELLLETDGDGNVDTVIRDYTLRASQAVKAYPDMPDGKVTKAAGAVGTENQEFRFLHLIGPRGDRVMGRLDGPNRPFTDIVVCVEDKTVLRNSGFYEHPFVTPRWYTRPNEIYGRGRGAVALGDVKTLQQSMKDTMAGAAQTVRPSIMVPDDGMMSPVSIRPGDLVKVRWDLLMRGAHPRPLITGARPDLGEDFMQSIRRRVDDAYFKTVMQRFRDPRMTATQVLKEEEETLRLLGPVLGRLQQEDLGPMIKRTFAVMWRRGLFASIGPLPEALGRTRLEIEYVSPISRAQKLSEVRGIAETFEVLAPIRATNPEIDDNFDFDETARIVATLRDVPASILRDVRSRDALRRGRQEAAAAEAERQAVNEAAAAAGQAAPALQLVQNAANENQAAA